MKPVIQQENTGCAIASSAALAGISYTEAKIIANKLGIYAENSNLWSESKHIRRVLKILDIKTEPSETVFKNWGSLPECALLAIKWHMKNGRPYWHWVVYVRKNNQEYVLDSKKALKANKSTDFGRIKPKWYIKIHT